MIRGYFTLNLSLKKTVIYPCVDLLYTQWGRTRSPNDWSYLTPVLGATRSTIHTLLHDKINPKDCQVLSLGDSGLLLLLNGCFKLLWQTPSYFTLLNNCFFWVHLQCEMDPLQVAIKKMKQKYYSFLAAVVLRGFMGSWAPPLFCWGSCSFFLFFF